MSQALSREGYPFTFLFKREDSQWVSLACEIDVSSCGDTLDEARDGLKDAVELYVSHMLEHGMRESIARPVPRDVLTEFSSEAGKTLQVERYVLVVILQAAPEMEFIPTAIGPFPICDAMLPALAAQ